MNSNSDQPIDNPQDPPKKTRRKPVPPPPPKGNKYALGNLGGRPRVWDPKIEAQALLEWVEEPTSITLLDFATSRGYVYDNLLDWCNNCPEFNLSHKLAKQTIATRREKLALAGKIKEGVFHRYQAMYDKHLHSFERAEKEFDLKMRLGGHDGGSNLAELLRMLSEKKISEEAFLKLLSAIPGVVVQSNDSSK